MGRKSKQELQLLKACKINDSLSGSSNRLSENDKRTLNKRNQVKAKLKTLNHADQNIDDLLTSLECYCTLILQSIKTV